MDTNCCWVGYVVYSNGSSSEGGQKGSSAVAESRGGLSPTHRLVSNVVDETNQGYDHSAPLPVHCTGDATQIFRATLTSPRRKLYHNEFSVKVINRIVFDIWRDACGLYDPELAGKTYKYRQQWAECIVHIPVETATAPVE